MADNKPNDTQDKVKMYRELVLQYEDIDAEIDALIMAADGMPERMTAEAMTRYRELARRRDDLQNEMRWLEQQLMDEEE